MLSVKRLLFSLARTPLAGELLREVFCHMSFAIPVKRLYETSSLLAFRHPQPSYPFHVLLVPKRPYRSLIDIAPEDVDFQRDLFETVRSLVHEFRLENIGYRLIANGGTFQEAPILHFHLVSDKSLEEEAR